MGLILGVCALVTLFPAAQGFAQPSLLERSLGSVQGAGWSGTAQLQVSPPPEGVQDKDAKPVDTKKNGQRNFSSVYQLGLVVGREVRIAVPMARYFGLPTEDADRIFREVAMPQAEEGRTRYLQLRRRPGTEQVDIFFSERIEGQGAYYFHVSADGTLLRAIHLNGRVTPLGEEEARRRFAAELAYWRQWERDTNRTAAANGATGGGN